MRLLTALLLVLTTTTAIFADDVEDVRQAEIAFAKAFADRDSAKFFSFVAEDATFLAGGSTLRGKQQVMEGWGRMLSAPQAPFSWGPERVSVSADGTLALSTGPVYAPDGQHSGSYISTWRKQSDGSWKVLFDSSGPSPVPFAQDVTAVEEGFVTTADGVQLKYRKVGRSPRVLIVPFDALLFERVKQFADVATVITYDMRNRGRSSRAKTLDTFTIEQDIADLEAVRAHFKAEKFVPMGYSYLGKMVMLYAAAHPQRVSRIVQLAPASNERVAPNEDREIGAPEGVFTKWQTMMQDGSMQKTPREFCEAQTDFLRYLLVGDPKKAARVDAHLCTLENEWPMNVNPIFDRLLPSLEKRVLGAEALKNLTMPVLTIHGTKDRNAPYAGGRAWTASLPNARLVTIEGAAHALYVEEPAAVSAAIRQFLRGEWPHGSQTARP